MKEVKKNVCNDCNGEPIAKGDIVTKIDENGIEFVDETTFDPIKFSVNKVLKTKSSVVIKDVEHEDVKSETRAAKLCMKA